MGNPHNSLCAAKGCYRKDIDILGQLHIRHCVRAVKEMDSKSIGLCPQGFESPRCRISIIL